MAVERALRPVALEPLGRRPLVSVLIPLYNYERFVARAISSVLEQSYDDFELIVCDDGSTDGSLAVARHFAAQDSRVKVIAKQNGGQASALNAAWREHRGEIICILDADDVFLPHKLQRVVQKYLDKPDAGVLVHSMILLDEREQQVETIPFLSQFEDGWIGDKVIRRGGRWRFMPSSALSFRAELGPYCTPIPEEKFRENAESFVFTILPLFTCVEYIREPLSCYRMHDSNMSGEFAFTPATVRYRENWMRAPIDAVNEQLESMGYPQRLDRSRNLDFAMIRFKRHMLEPQPLGARLRCYRDLVALAMRDDLLGPGGKLMITLGHGASFFLRPAGRQWVFNRMLSPNALKRILRTLRDTDTRVRPGPHAGIDCVPES